MAERSFVSFAGGDWWYHGPAHADFQVMRALSKKHSALIVNSIGMRFPTPGKTDRVLMRIGRKLRSTLRFLRRPLPETHPKLWVMTPVSVPVFGIAPLRKLNAMAVAAQVWVVSRLVLRQRSPWAIVVIPTAVDVVDSLRWRKILYYRADDHAASADVDMAVIRSLEDRLIARSKLVLYSSQALMDAEAARSGTKARRLDHGVELDHFAPAPAAVEPSDLAVIPHPRIGFFGQVDRAFVDFELLGRLATELDDAHVVLVGKIDSTIGALAEMPNVHLLGWRNYTEVPSYGRGFDVGICPFPSTEWVKGANPIKLKEYLALGLPVVTSAIPDVARYDGVVQIAGDHDAFVAAVRDAVTTGGPSNPGSRRAAVMADGWDERGAQVDIWCDELEQAGR